MTVRQPPVLLCVVLRRQERLREAAEAEARAKRLEAEAQVRLDRGLGAEGRALGQRQGCVWQGRGAGAGLNRSGAGLHAAFWVVGGSPAIFLFCTECLPVYC
jgi:hypothetical protein